MLISTYILKNKVTIHIKLCQAPLSMEFFRQEYWSGFPFPSPGDLPDPGIEPRSPALQADVLPSEPPGKPQAWDYLREQFQTSMLEFNTVKSFRCGERNSTSQINGKPI